MWGLSPRGRGNLRLASDMVRVFGAIPARAGEPTRSMAGPSSLRGYPRAGGGTLSADKTVLLTSGLSPRGRGNLHPMDLPDDMEGAIPARAGEPRAGPGA